MFSNPERFIGGDATARALFRRSGWVNLNKMSAFNFALVFKQCGERIPRC